MITHVLLLVNVFALSYEPSNVLSDDKRLFIPLLWLHDNKSWERWIKKKKSRIVSRISIKYNNNSRKKTNHVYKKKSLVQMATFQSWQTECIKKLIVSSISLFRTELLKHINVMLYMRVPNLNHILQELNKSVLASTAVRMLKKLIVEQTQ